MGKRMHCCNRPMHGCLRDLSLEEFVQTALINEDLPGLLIASSEVVHQHAPVEQSCLDLRQVFADLRGKSIDVKLVQGVFQLLLHSASSPWLDGLPTRV